MGYQSRLNGVPIIGRPKQVTVKFVVPEDVAERVMHALQSEQHANLWGLTALVALLMRQESQATFTPEEFSAAQKRLPELQRSVTEEQVCFRLRPQPQPDATP